METKAVSDNDPDDTITPSLLAFRVLTRQSPYFDTFYEHHTVRITIDSGATGNMIRHSVVKRLCLPLAPSSQSAHQADGSSPLQIVSQTRLSFTRDQRAFTFEGLVVENLSVHPAKRQVILGDGTCYTYGSPKAQTVDTTTTQMVLHAPSA